MEDIQAALLELNWARIAGAVPLPPLNGTAKAMIRDGLMDRAGLLTPAGVTAADDLRAEVEARFQSVPPKARAINKGTEAMKVANLKKHPSQIRAAAAAAALAADEDCAE